MNTQQKGTTMQHLRGVWFSPESAPGEQNVADVVRGAVANLPDMTHARVTTRLPNGTVFSEEGRVRASSAEHLTLIPALSGDDEMTGWPRRIPWVNVVSVEVS